MAGIEDLKNLGQEPPNGMRPGVHIDGGEGYVTTSAVEDPNHEDIAKVLRASNLNPDDFLIDWARSSRITTHLDRNGDLVQIWLKLPIYRKPERTFDVEDLLDDLYLPDGPKEPTDSAWRTIMISDQHIGKGSEAGGGTTVILDRWKQGVFQALGDRSYEGINLVLGGDTIEGYVSQNGRNIRECDLILSEQIRTAQHAISWTIQELLQVAKQVVVSVVPGNHAETTRVQSMPLGDNFDVMILRNVEQAFQLAGAEKRVRFEYPKLTEGHVTYEAGGATFCVVHGHKFKSQMRGAQEWWSGHIANDRDPAKATILLAGHFHNFQACAWTSKRWVLFAPSLETESTWLTATNGASSRPGVLTFLTDGGEPKELEIC